MCIDIEQKEVGDSTLFYKCVRKKIRRTNTNTKYIHATVTMYICATYIWESQILLFLTHVYDTKMYLKKLFDKRFWRIFSSAFQWCSQFFRNFPFWPSKSLSHSISRRKDLGHSLENILSYVKTAANILALCFLQMYLLLLHIISYSLNQLLAAINNVSTEKYLCLRYK